MKSQFKKLILNLLLKIQKDFEHAERIDQNIRIAREKVFLKAMNIRI